MSNDGSDAERAGRQRTYRKELPDIAHELLLRLIENEVNSALIFAATAWNAYRCAKFSEGNAALSKAEAIYVQASELAQEGGAQKDQATADRLRELRSAIDALMSAKQKAYH